MGFHANKRTPLTGPSGKYDSCFDFVLKNIVIRLLICCWLYSTIVESACVPKFVVIVSQRKGVKVSNLHLEIHPNTEGLC